MQNKWGWVLVFLITLTLVGIGGLFIHELGHGFTALALGGKFNALYAFPGIQIWPQLGQPYRDGVWRGYVGLADSDCTIGGNANGWQPGLCALMGSGSNLLVAALAMVFLWIFQPRRWLRHLLLAQALMFLDLPLYTFLPQVGLKHFFIIGGDSPEPLEGAVRLGLTPVVFMVLVSTISLMMSLALIWYVHRHPLWDS